MNKRPLGVIVQDSAGRLFSIVEDTAGIIRIIPLNVRVPVDAGEVEE